MKDRIVQFLAAEKLSAAEFADKIGVQRSSISHILNGRNYPSANFIQKMLLIFPLLNSRWLMVGTGEMYSNTPPVELLDNHTIEEVITDTKNDNVIDFDAKESTIKNNKPFSVNISDFSSRKDTEVSNGSAEENPSKSDHYDGTGVNKIHKNSLENPAGSADLAEPESSLKIELPSKEIEQILFFYKDKTFTVYRPS